MFLDILLGIEKGHFTNNPKHISIRERYDGDRVEDEAITLYTDYLYIRQEDMVGKCMSVHVFYNSDKAAIVLFIGKWIYYAFHYFQIQNMIYIVTL